MMKMTSLLILILTLWTVPAYSAKEKPTCDPILALVPNEFAYHWITRLNPSLHANDQFIPSGFSREELNEILDIPRETTSRTHLEMLLKMYRWREFDDSRGSSFTMLSRARSFVAEYHPKDTGGRPLADIRFSLLRELFSRISELADWQAYDYSYSDRTGRHYVFVGRLVARVIVIRARDGAVVPGIVSALKEHTIPDQKYYEAPFESRK